MKTATVNEIGRDFLAVLKWVETGEEVQVVNEGRAVARILPPQAEGTGHFQQPDFEARLKRIFGDRVLSPAESAQLRDDLRGER